MKKTFLLILLFSVITGTSSSLASMIQIYDINGSYNANLYGPNSYEFTIGEYNPVWLVSIHKENFNNTVKIDTQGAQNLISMLQRTYLPIYDNELTHLYTTNSFYGTIYFFGPPDAIWSDRYYFNSIPDLSAYHIDALYLNNSFSTDGASGEYDIQLLADSTPIVPEPSTILLLGVGLSVLVFIRKKISI